MGKVIQAVLQELRPVEEQWGVKIHEFGFSTFSPSPETLEITQLRKLAEEKLHLYQRFRQDLGLGEEAAVALISGAVIAVRGQEAPPSLPPRPKVGVAGETAPGEADGRPPGASLPATDGAGPTEAHP